MAKDYPDDFARGYEYARQRYGELADRFDSRVLMDLAAALARASGGNAELARGIAAGLEAMTRQPFCVRRCRLQGFIGGCGREYRK